MSIKYLGDNQLNQIQNDPNDTPWAKLIAQSEMLERNKMRQPQGQFPQGTVASAIQQQLLNNQMQQANQVQGLDAEKARILAQLIGSGQLQGMADGGLTPSMSNPQLAPMLGASPIKPQIAQTQLAPTKEAIDQQPHHDIFQRLLDNSIIGVAQGKGSLNDTLQLYADMWTGKALKGLSEGGEIRGFSGKGGSLIEQLNREVYGKLKNPAHGWTNEAGANYRSPYNQSFIEGLYKQGLSPTGEPINISDILSRSPIQGAPAIGEPTSMSNVLSNRTAPNPRASYINNMMSQAAQAAQAAPSSSVSPRGEYINSLMSQNTPSDMSDLLKGRGGQTAAPQTGPAEKMGPPRGAAMSSPEAQAYLRDPSFIGNATKASDFVGPQAGGKPPRMPGAITSDVADISAAENFANQMVNRPESEYKNPELRNKLLSAFPGVEMGLTSLGSSVLPNANDLNELMTYFKKPNQGSDWHPPMQLEGQEQASTPTATASNPTVTEQSKAPVKPPITKDNVVAVARAHNYDKQQSQVLDAAQKEAALNQTQQAISKTAGEDSTESLYRQLKDADLDYAELAKRISENEKDLAQERKDGTLTAVLTGVGAALSRAGTLEQKGDRVFTPGIGQILGAGILGGIESSEATDKKYRTGIEKNLEALNALQGLKRAAHNDMMDAMVAENQTKMLASHYRAQEDRDRQKTPVEIAYMQSQINENNANAQRLKSLGAGASKPMTENQKANLQKSAMAAAFKELSGSSEFSLMSSEDQQVAIANRAKEIFAVYMGGTNTATPAPAADPMAAIKAKAAEILAARSPK